MDSFQTSRNFQDDYLDYSLTSNFEGVLRLLQRSESFQKNLNLLKKFANISGNEYGDVTKFDELVALFSAFLRREAENEQRKRVLINDCQYVEGRLRQIIDDKRALDELFQTKLNEKLSGATHRTIFEQQSDTSFLRKKIQRYEKSASDLKRELNEIRGFDAETLSRQRLLENDAKNEALNEQLAKLKKALQHYRDLPPSTDLAHLRLAEAKQELAELKTRVFERFDS